MKKLFAVFSLTLALAVSICAPAHAQVAQVPDVPAAPHTVVGANAYAVFDVTSPAVGDYSGLFEKQPNGMMSPVGTCITVPDYSAADNLNAAGSDIAYVKAIIHDSNDKFPKCIKAYFDAFSFALPPTTAQGRINAALGAICGFNNANQFICP